MLCVLALTASMFVWLGVFHRKRVANRRLKRLAEVGKIKRVALVQVNPVGPPEYLYYHKALAATLAQHQAELSRFLLWFLPDAEILTGTDVDPAVLADADVILKNGKRFHVEWCRGTMTYQQCEKRWEDAYAGTERVVLWVASTDTRLQGFLDRVAKFKRPLNILLTTADEAIDRGPFEPIWCRRGETEKRAIRHE